MKNELLKLVVAFLSVAVLSATIGCGGDDYGMAQVSGTVTLDGKPLPGVQVNFFPKATADSANVGPFSSGITDDQGKYSLTNRYGDPGAVVGVHSVSVKYEGVSIEEVMEAEDEVREVIEDLKDGDATKIELDEAKGQLKEIRAAASRGGTPIPAKYGFGKELSFTVTEAGSDAADFELTSD